MLASVYGILLLSWACWAACMKGSVSTLEHYWSCPTDIKAVRVVRRYVMHDMSDYPSKGRRQYHTVEEDSVERTAPRVYSKKGKRTYYGTCTVRISLRIRSVMSGQLVELSTEYGGKGKVGTGILPRDSREYRHRKEKQ